MPVKRRKLGDEPLIPLNSSLLVKIRDKLRSLGIAHGLLGRPAEGVTELFVKIKGNDGFGEVVEVSTEDVRGIVDGISIPDKALAIPIRRVENGLELLDPLFRTAEAENAFDTGGYKV